jgi:transcriptional regulator with PAS, ATPase and Fis domain
VGYSGGRLHPGPIILIFGAGATVWRHRNACLVDEVDVLRIGLTGLMASHAPTFARMSTASQVQWSSVAPSQERSETAELDLLIELGGQTERLSQHDKKRDTDRLVASWRLVPKDASELDAAIQRAAQDVYGFIVGYSPAMHLVCRWVRALADQITVMLDLRGLIVGETGTGKELVAESVHRLGRGRGIFVPVNCAGIPRELIDSELFGHAQGAFTGAMRSRQGAIARAGRGVLFLDEIADLPLELQGKLLRVLESRQFTPVGSDRSQPVKSQIIAATNQPIADRVREGVFRADLFFRLAQIQVLVPPLRDRISDLPLLIQKFLEPHGLRVEELGSAVMSILKSYQWPGNVRELRSLIEHYVLMRRASGLVDATGWCTQAIQDSSQIVAPPPFPAGAMTPPASSWQSAAPRSLQTLTDHFQRDVLREVLIRCGWDTSKTAKQLGVTRRTVYNLIHKYGLTVGQG